MDQDKLDALWEATRTRITAMAADGGRWRHYKGDIVRVIGPAINEATLEPCIVYEHNGIIWCRELHVWDRQVLTGDNDLVPRFTRCESTPHG